MQTALTTASTVSDPFVPSVVEKPADRWDLEHMWEQLADAKEPSPLQSFKWIFRVYVETPLSTAEAFAKLWKGHVRYMIFQTAPESPSSQRFVHLGIAVFETRMSQQHANDVFQHVVNGNFTIKVVPGVLHKARVSASKPIDVVQYQIGTPLHPGKKQRDLSTQRSSHHKKRKTESTNSVTPPGEDPAAKLHNALVAALEKFGTFVAEQTSLLREQNEHLIKLIQKPIAKRQTDDAKQLPHKPTATRPKSSSKPPPPTPTSPQDDGITDFADGDAFLRQAK